MCNVAILCVYSCKEAPMGTRMNIYIPDDLVEAVQQIKEDIGVSRFFRKKVKEYIKAKNDETSGKGGTTWNSQKNH